jgi:hypothetical protein
MNLFAGRPTHSYRGIALSGINANAAQHAFSLAALCIFQNRPAASDAKASAQ